MIFFRTPSKNVIAVECDLRTYPGRQRQTLLAFGEATPPKVKTTPESDIFVSRAAR